MSGHWPSEWDDAENLDPEFEARLAEVAAFLAAVPDPALPPGIEARISAAIAAEAQSAPTRSGVADLSAFDQKPRDHRSRDRESRDRKSRSQRSGSRRSRVQRLRSVKVLAPVAACLVLAVGGYFASLGGNSSRQATSASSAASSPRAAAASAPAAAAAPFVVTMSGTKYAAATLAAQARAELVGYAADQSRHAATAAPRSQETDGGVSASAPAVPGPKTAFFSLPSAGLLGCVEHFTGGGKPRLVDRGTYRGTPVYVIVGVSHVWVVGLGCTASRPELLASAAVGGDTGISAP